MEKSSIKNQLTKDLTFGTLAIDLGNSTTVVAFQGEKDKHPILLDLPPISREKGEIPTLVISSDKIHPNVLIGKEVLNFAINENQKIHICSDFKRWIGTKRPLDFEDSTLLPEKAGELLIQHIWKNIPAHLVIKRLVLTAPVETYRSYRTWLSNVCNELPVNEIAIVDEPTAAALGAGIPAGSKLLVIDIGGCTIDLSLVALEGGEGHAEPIAQLIKFAGKDLEESSFQSLRCAKVLGKAGLRLGGRDFDRWIASHLFPNEPLTEKLLNAAERLKCRLSQNELQSNETLEEQVEPESGGANQYLKLNRSQLETLLIKRGLLKSLAKLLSQTMKNGYANNCTLKDIHSAVVVGGGARIPMIRKWLEENIKPAPLLTPPPIEAVAKGALSLTPGVTVRDVLLRGISLRCWDKKSEKHIWHPIFVAGQPWPTTKGLKLILSASTQNQLTIDLVIGEPQSGNMNEVIYVDGIPTIKSDSITPQLNPWEGLPHSLSLNPPGNAGEDCLQLTFQINDAKFLEVETVDLRNGVFLEKKELGLVS